LLLTRAFGKEDRQWLSTIFVAKDAS
jgi:hypothetical protein